ncbi:MAG: hypothetical protein AB1640_17040 [bacterium]
MLATDIKSLVQNPGAYEDRHVEVTGRVEYRVPADRSQWGFFLKDEAGRFIRCVERNDRAGDWAWEERVAQQADLRNQELTVAGLFNGSEIRLNRIWFRGLSFDTDYDTRSFGSP